MNDEVRDRDVALQEMGRFLSACYYEPGPEFAEERVFESIERIGRVLGTRFEAAAVRLGRAFAAEAHQALLIDYTRLFLGPVDVLAQPYEASWTAGAGTGPESIRAIEALYRDGGFGVADDFRERADHVAVELEFHYLMRARENEARSNGDAGGAARARALRSRLVREHLGRWIPAFAAAIAVAAHCEYYRQLAGLTAAYVALELAESS